MSSTNDGAASGFFDSLGKTIISAAQARYVDRESNSAENTVPDYADNRTGNLPNALQSEPVKYAAIAGAIALVIGVAIYAASR